jgi:hypothetical protein
MRDGGMKEIGACDVTQSLWSLVPSRSSAVSLGRIGIKRIRDDLMFAL